MREHAAGVTVDVPEAPDMSESMSAMVQSVWAAAWKRASARADEATAVALDAVRGGEADALAAAEKSEAEKHEAAAERDRAPTEAETLRRELEQLRGQLDTARSEAAEARVEAKQAGQALARSEATSDTLRQVLDDLRKDLRDAGSSSKS